MPPITVDAPVTIAAPPPNLVVPDGSGTNKRATPPTTSAVPATNVRAPPTTAQTYNPYNYFLEI